MLLRNAHWILLVVCLLLIYIIYTANDESPGPKHGFLESSEDVHSMPADNEITETKTTQKYIRFVAIYICPHQKDINYHINI